MKTAAELLAAYRTAQTPAAWLAFVEAADADPRFLVSRLAQWNRPVRVFRLNGTNSRGSLLGCQIYKTRKDGRLVTVTGDPAAVAAYRKAKRLDRIETAVRQFTAFDGLAELLTVAGSDRPRPTLRGAALAETADAFDAAARKAGKGLAHRN